jgi:hypothetical protein
MRWPVQFSMDRIEAALYLANHGEKVFPLHGVREDSTGRLVCTCGKAACRDAGKHPMAKFAPRGLNDATADCTLIRRWFTAVPLANIGMVTGKTIALDVDPRHGGDASLEVLEAEHGPLPATTRVLTGGGGEHILFRAPAGIEIRSSVGALAPGLDVRGVGGYVVAPSSRHESGRFYTWSVDHHPEEVMPAEMPRWLVAALSKSSGRRQARGPSELQRLTIEGVADGTRNTTLTKLIGYLLRRYVDPVVAYELVQAWNEMRCRPPLTPDEVTRIVGSIARKELRRRESKYGGRH